MKNLSGHNTIVNSLAVNEDGVLVSGGDNGSLHFWDYETGCGPVESPVPPVDAQTTACLALVMTAHAAHA